jgi:hypothetical protein
MSPRTEREIEVATDIYMQLQYLGQESLQNLLHSVVAEIGRKGGFLSKEARKSALFAVKEAGK